MHIEGTLEPELAFELAARNKVHLPYADVDALRRAYRFEDLQSFLDIYYANCAVLRTEQDFYDLTHAYLSKAAGQGVRHAEIFFDPQTHTQRGVAFETCCMGISRALSDGAARAGDLVGPDPVLPARPQRGGGAADPARRRGPLPSTCWPSASTPPRSATLPAKFARVFRQAREMGLPGVVHAGEEGPPEYIWEALDVLEARRIDHGVRCLEDDRLVARLAAEQIPLTVCPFSNVKLRVFPSLRAARPAGSGAARPPRHDQLGRPRLFRRVRRRQSRRRGRGVRPPRDVLAELARNSFRAAFLPGPGQGQIPRRGGPLRLTLRRNGAPPPPPGPGSRPEQHGVHEERGELEQRHPLLPAGVQRLDLAIGVEQPVGHRAEESEHGQVLLGMPAVDGRVDDPRTAVAPGEDVAPPEVAVHEDRPSGWEELLQSGGDETDDALECTAGGQVAQARPVERRAVGPGGRVDGAGPHPGRAATPVREGRLVQQRQAAPERLVVPGGPGHLIDRGGDEEIGLLEHDVRYRRASGRRAELAQALGFVAATRPELGDEVAPIHFDQIGGAPEQASRIDSPHGDRQAPAHA